MYEAAKRIRRKNNFDSSELADELWLFLDWDNMGHKERIEEFLGAIRKAKYDKTKLYFELFEKPDSIQDHLPAVIKAYKLEKGEEDHYLNNMEAFIFLAKAEYAGNDKVTAIGCATVLVISSIMERHPNVNPYQLRSKVEYIIDLQSKNPKKQIENLAMALKPLFVDPKTNVIPRTVP